LNDESIEERLARLEQKILQHDQRLEKLENHVYHPPHIEKLLNEIKNRKVVTIQELKQHVPKLHGGTITRLYEAVENDQRFRIVPGRARWTQTILAYFGSEGIPNDAILLAIDYFQRIPAETIVSTVDAMGRRRKTKGGKEGSLEGIMEAYKIDKDKAYEVWQEILRLFEQRMDIPPGGIKTFRRKY